MVLLELGVVCLCFGFMSLMILMGPGNLEPAKLFALSIPLMVIATCFLAMTGVMFCSFGLVQRRSLVKWPLIWLSAVGVSSFPVAIYEGLDELSMLRFLKYLSAWCILLLFTSLGAFYFKEYGRMKRGRN